MRQACYSGCAFLEEKPDEYWKDTSDNAIIRSFIDYVGASLFF